MAQQVLEEKLHNFALVGVSALASASGGFMLGWFESRGIYPEYYTLLTYGPLMFVGSSAGVRSGLQKYTQERETPLLEGAFFSASKTAVASALVGGSLAAYNTLVFYGVGLAAGTLLK